jgi:hypothetical protein
LRRALYDRGHSGRLCRLPPTTLGARDELGDATQAWLARCIARPAFVSARKRQVADTG